MDSLYDLESLAVVADANDDFDGLFQDLFHEPQPIKSTLPMQEPNSTYLVKLEGPLGTASKAQRLAGMLYLPEQVDGIGEASGGAYFCFVNGADKCEITAALSKHAVDCFHLTFIRINRAAKALSSDSAAPCLGYDATLPHHRAAEAAHVFLPAQSEYPVWYFFYETLANSEVLMEKLELPVRPNLRPATVEQGNIRTWGGKYKALLDGVDTVKGWAYKVVSASHEDVPRYYEADRYEVVRCTISMDDTRETVQGLAFRFIGVCDLV
ncbi:hypothetical protein BDW62DRAFT_201628 [Aspergillus aurantiobrunneus]